MQGRHAGESGGELFQLADQLALTFWLPGTDTQRRRLQDLASSEWERMKECPRVVWLTYVLRLGVTCPPLLDGPPGFEWIPNTIRWELFYRKANQSADRDFWKAVSQVRTAVRRGRPSNKARDYVTHQRVLALMKDEGLKRTQAVHRLVELREGSGDARAIWRSLARVEKEIAQRKAMLTSTPHESLPPRQANSQATGSVQRKRKR